MGYYTHIEGEAKVTGGLIPEKIIEDRMWTKGGDGDYFWIEEVGEPDDVALVDGILTVINGDKHQIVHYRWEDKVKAYGFDESCNILLEEVKRAGAEIHGDFNAEGEESGDLWRARFRGTEWVRQTPQVVWPDD